jgi:type IV pilus assembly protein PilO
MGKFASGIAALPRIVTLHDIEIAPPGSDRNVSAPAGDLVLNVTAKTYRYLDEDEQSPQDDGSKGGKAKKKGKQKPEAG